MTNIDLIVFGFLLGVSCCAALDYWSRDRSLERPGPSQREIEEDQARWAAREFQKCCQEYEERHPDG